MLSVDIKGILQWWQLSLWNEMFWKNIPWNLCSLTVSLERGFPLGMITGDKKIISVYSIRREPKQCLVRNWDAPTNPPTPRSACRTVRHGSSTKQWRWNTSRFSLHTSWSFSSLNIVRRGCQHSFHPLVAAGSLCYISSTRIQVGVFGTAQFCVVLWWDLLQLLKPV